MLLLSKRTGDIHKCLYCLYCFVLNLPKGGAEQCRRTTLCWPWPRWGVCWPRYQWGQWLVRRWSSGAASVRRCCQDGLGSC